MKKDKWLRIRRLGEGGQGKVYLAADTESLRLSDFECTGLMKAADAIRLRDGWQGIMSPAQAQSSWSSDLTPALFFPIFRIAAGIRFGALKELKGPGEWVRDPETVPERFAKELEVLGRVDHPNLVRLLDGDKNERWFVTEFYPAGTIKDRIGMFANRPADALKAFRGLVEAVEMLHKSGLLHRDIKPENVFVGASGQLILGDLGLVFEEGSDDRPTKTVDNVGTYAWMPPWAMNRRLDEFDPTFDVYSLGKVLWSLAEGSPRCDVEYERGSIIAACGDCWASRSVERIVEQCVVLKKQECLPDIETLLGQVNDAIVESDIQVPVQMVRMCAHALSRPGGLFLFRAEAPCELGEPITAGRNVEWLVEHPKAAGLGLPMVEKDVYALSGSAWESFLKHDKTAGRYMIRIPTPRSMDNFLECRFEPIPLEYAKYLHVTLKADPVSPLLVYLRLGNGDDLRWLAYSTEAQKIASAWRSEYAIPIGRRMLSGQMESLHRDIQRDLALTWGKDNVTCGPLTGIRIRGAFKLLLIHVV